jgi:hypothetical protein
MKPPTPNIMLERLPCCLVCVTNSTLLCCGAQFEVRIGCRIESVPDYRTELGCAREMFGDADFESLNTIDGTD